MGTTDATRPASSPDAAPDRETTPDEARPGESSVASSPVQVGIEWGYPISLVRRLGIALLAAILALLVVSHVLKEPGQELDVILHTIPVALAVLIALYISEAIGVTVRPMPPLSLEKMFWSLSGACVAMAIGYALLPTYAPSMLVAAGAPLAAAVAIVLQRKWVETRAFREMEVPTVLFASTRESAHGSIETLRATPALRIRGIILPDSVSDRNAIDGLSVFSPDDGFHWYRTEGIRLFVVADESSTDDLRAVLAPCAGAGCTVEKVNDLVAAAFGRVHLGRGDDVGLITRLTHKANRFPAQRFIDTSITLLFSPFIVLLSIPVAILVRLSSKGPTIYSQKRVGRWGKEFTIHKFRTMSVDAEKSTGPVWAQANDPRITPLGRVLRTTRLDELPQFWNVVRGDMSLVGPRPERMKFVEDLRAEIPFYDVRHAVRPGITGWAQIRYPYGSTVDDAERKLEYELFYIANRSSAFYFAVLLETLKVILFRRGGM
jgi:exopolysaccharide biosynthesis polyprenyl glycosylphosphotransferase